jgi:hypothetical protein
LQRRQPATAVPASLNRLTLRITVGDQ